MPKFTTPQLSWLTTLGKEADIVLASRVRLARNFKKIYHFLIVLISMI